MQKDYSDITGGLDEDEKKALRKEWEAKLAGVLDDENVAVSAAARLKKAQKHMLEAVCTVTFLIL